MNSKPRHKQVPERVLKRLDALLRAREDLRAKKDPEHRMPVLLPPKSGVRYHGLF